MPRTKISFGERSRFATFHHSCDEHIIAIKLIVIRRDASRVLHKRLSFKLLSELRSSRAQLNRHTFVFGMTEGAMKGADCQ